MDDAKRSYKPLTECPDDTSSEELSVRQMLRLYEDLEDFADKVDPEDRICLQIVHSSKGLCVYGKGSTPDVTPLLAAALRASLERRMTVEAEVRAKLRTAWEAVLQQR